jgi:hypothetical protein
MYEDVETLMAMNWLFKRSIEPRVITMITISITQPRIRYEMEMGGS